MTATTTPLRPWINRASDLAGWAWARYVVRSDVWGGYTPLKVRGQERRREDGTTYIVGPTLTRPARNKRGIVKLTLDTLERHFRATCPEQVVGIHTTSSENWSRFGTVEIDSHGADGNKPEQTFRAALAWYDRATVKGFRPLLWDSDGKGGYHLDFLFADPVSTAGLFWWLRDFVEDHSAYGLTARPETFPKQQRINRNGRCPYGNWCRLVGRHHTQDVWARVWNGSTWLDSEAAVEHVLSLTGDPPTLLPAGAEVRGRIRAYRAKLPNKSEGQGRDDVAYGFLAFMVRDLALSDAEALNFADEWDAHNSPPKGRERLAQILASVHVYGQHAYGAGLNGKVHTDEQAPAPDTVPLTPPATPTPSPRNDGLGIILADFRERLKPVFKRGTAVFSEALGREVKPAEGCYAPDRQLVNKLANATDAPRDNNGEPDPRRIPKFYRDWARSSWQEMLNGLVEEAATAEVVPCAEEEFRRAVTAALHEQVTLGREGEEPERRSLLNWCDLWAGKLGAPGTWQSIRSYLIWCRRVNATAPVEIALRCDLFSQVRSRELAALGHRKFAALAELYGIGIADRAGGQRVVVLAAGFLTDVRQGPTLTE
jgi:hypothetical protein